MSELSVATAIIEILDFLSPYCDDKSTLEEVRALASNEKYWKNGYAAFCKIRDKTLIADSLGNHLLQRQYALEEVCAKTLFNLSGCKGPPFPFDDDTPFWIIPYAISFASAVGIENPYAMSRLLQT